MSTLNSLSDAELVERLPALVAIERHAMVDVIEHLVEMERRRLYLRESCSCLYRYCMDRLGYAKDAALNRHRVALLALRVPQVLDELRAGTMNLTGLFLLSKHLDEKSATSLLGQARGKSSRQIQELVAELFPRPDVPQSIQRIAEGPESTCCATGEPARGIPGRLEPLSPTRLRVEFTANAALYEKISRARDLSSHAVPNGDLGELFERAIDALLEKETRRRFGAGKQRKARPLKEGSRHVPVEIARAVWERDDSRCTFVDGEGHRCAERRFLTIEHRTPFALGGLPTVENLCLLCSAHNLESARQVFGAAHVEAKIREQTGAPAQVLASLCGLGFARSEASAVIGLALGAEPGLDVEQLLRTCLLLLVPKAS